MIKMVFAIPAETGGALSNLMEIYNEALLDTSNQWIFVIGLADLEPYPHIKVVNYPSVKKSWLKRLFFDLITYQKLIKKYKPDSVYNQQSFVPSKKIKVLNYFYATNVLFFSDIYLSPTRDFHLWLRRLLLKPTEVYSIKKADLIIVESDWFRDYLSNRYKLSLDKFVIKSINTKVKKKKDFCLSSPCNFFYPASGFSYKNHETILKAAFLLKEQGYEFTISFTLLGNENDYVQKLKKHAVVNRLPVNWVGILGLQELESYYESSILVFPSVLESAGLPLYEAKEMGTPVICSDLGFSHSAMRDYKEVLFFNPYDSEALFNYMKQYCTIKK